MEINKKYRQEDGKVRGGNPHLSTTTLNNKLEMNMEAVQMIVVPKMADRTYILVKPPATTPLGMQRRIVLQIMLDAKGQPVKVSDAVVKAEEMGLQAAAGVAASVAWHLNEMRKKGEVEIVIAR